MSLGSADRLSALLFDVLHTLVDDSGFPSRYMHTLLEAEGHEVDPDELLAVYREVTDRHFDWEEAAVEEPFRSIRDRHEARVEEVYQRLEVSEERDITRDTEWLWKQIANSRVYPDVPEVLPVLAERGYRLALISNADENDPVIQVLLRSGLPVRFEEVITSQGAGAYKPARRIFEHVLERLELEPERVLMVGDSPSSDVMGAKRMGIPVVWVNRKGKSFPSGYPEPDAEVSDLKGLLRLL